MLVRYKASDVGVFAIPKSVVAFRIVECTGSQLWLGGHPFKHAGAIISWGRHSKELVCLDKDAEIVVEHIDPVDELLHRLPKASRSNGGVMLRDLVMLQRELH